MNSTRACVLAAALLLPSAALAYPPAPQHVIYGCVRDKLGTPLVDTNAQVILQTQDGVQLQAGICPGLARGINYSLSVPMDAGLTPNLYEPTALRVAAPFKLFVLYGQTTNLPIQMTGNFLALGKPAQLTRLDLTLGTDANGDGIPDEWELALLNQLGLTMDLSSLNANMDLLGHGLTLLQEFLLGNAMFDPANAFTLRLVDVNEGSPILEFTTMTGRSYALLGSPDLQNWSTLAFTIPAEGSGLAYTYCYTADIRTLQIQAVQPASGPPARFFRLVMQ